MTTPSGHWNPALETENDLRGLPSDGTGCVSSRRAALRKSGWRTPWGDANAMREIVLIVVVTVLSLVALFRPRVGLYGYGWFALMRPDALAWSEGRYPYSLALAAATLAGSVRFQPGLGEWLVNPFVLLLLALQIPIVLSAVFALNPALCYDPLDLYIRVIVMALLIPLLVKSEG